MKSMSMMFLANIIGFAAAGIGIIMFLPQIIRSWKTKQTKDVSFTSFTLIAAASFLWTVYGILMNAPPIILVNIVVFMLSIFMLLLKRKYG